jgi:hypothetical protein
MADQRITELVELPQGGVAANDVLPVADVSASQTKKVQVKSLIQAGFNLADASTLDISKINQASSAKFTGASIAPNTLTYDKIQQVSANKLLGRSASTGNVEEINCTVYIRTLLDDGNAAAARSTLELGAVATGNTINTSLLEDLSVTTGKINNLAITAGKLASDAVETAKILDGAVTSAKIQTSGITGANISAGAIDTIHLATSGVTLAKMAANSVGTVQLVDSGVTQAKLASNAVNTVNVVDSGITQVKLAANSVATINIASSGITQAKLASDAVATINIIDGAVTFAKMASGSVNTAQLVDSGVTQGKLASGSVATINVVDSAITLAKLASNSVSTSQIIDSGVTQSKLAANAVATINVADSGITQPKLAANAVNTINVVDSGITQAKLSSGAVDTVNIIDSSVTLAKLASNSVGTSQIIDSGITQAKLASGAVNTANVVDSAITLSKLATNSVDTSKIIDSGVTQSKLAADSVATINVVNSGITQIKLAADAVTTVNLANSGVTQAKLASNAIDTINIIDAAVTLAKLASNSVGSGQLIDSGVTQAKLASGSVATINIVDSSVTLAKMASNSVDTSQLVNSGVTQAKLSSDAVSTINIADAAVTLAKMASGSVGTAQLVASGVTQEKLAASSIATINIVDSGITQSKLASNAVSTINLANSGVTAEKIASGAVTIGKLNLASGELSGVVIAASSIPSGSYASGSVSTAAIADSAVTFAKIQQVASGVLLGRASAGSGNVETITLTEAGRALLDDADATAQRTTLGLDTMAVQAASGVAITGGTAVLSSGTITYATINGGVISGITDLAIADGGTGASTASGARTNLGLAVGSDVQAYDAALASIAGLTTASGQIIYTIDSDTYAVSTITAAGRAILDDTDTATQRTTLGLGSLAVQNTVASGNYDAGSIFAADISNNAITTAKIADSGITTVKLVDSGITSAKIVDSAIVTDKLASSSVTTAKVADKAISYAKIQDTSQSNVILGRVTVSGGTLEEIACTAVARSILDDASIEDIRTTLGLGTLAIQNGTFSGTSAGTNTGDQTITLTGDVTGTGTGTFAATIATGAVVEAKIADGAVASAKVADGAITAEKLADQSSSVVAAASPSASGAFTGQQWLNTNNGYEYTWDGSQWIRQSAINEITVSGDSVYSFASSYPDAFSVVIVPTLAAQPANAVFIGPASGSNATPSFRALQGNDMPAATASTRGAIIPGAGLSMTGSTLNHSNSATSGTYFKVAIDAQGHVVSGATALEAVDIPSIDASKITSGFFGSGVIADDAILASKLANYSTTKFGEAPPTADFIGQYFFNPLEKNLFLWDGNVWNPVGVSIGEIVFAGTYNASGNTVASTTSEGAAVGLTIGQPLPAASATFNRYYVVVESGGTGISPAPTVPLLPPDIILCNGSAWVEVDVSSTYVSQTAVQVSFTPAASLGSTNVQAALEEVSNECRNVNNVTGGVLDEVYGGTGYSSYTKGDILVASGTTGLIKLGVGSDGQIIKADSSQTSGLVWYTPASGTVLSVNATAPLSVASGTTTPHLTISNASTSAVGVVQLSDSTSTTSSTLAATPTAVKSAYDLADAALPKAGGTITGAVVVGTAGSLQFEGSIDDGFETTLAVANPTADRTITLPNVTGTVITTGDTSTVTNTMLAGSIADSKLSTISTAGKVSNSATTATSANTASAIVARDSSGNFSAGTIDATIDEGTF